MRPTLIHLVALLPILLLLSIGTPLQAAPISAEGNAKQIQTRKAGADHGQLSEREKWSLARESFTQAQAEEKRKDSEAAAYYYEVTLELLGSLDMASIEVPTHRVLAFQRKVLQKYDHFLASIDNLPSTAGPMAVMESVSPKGAPDEEELLDKQAEDRDLTPAPITPNAKPLPEVPQKMNGQVAGQINFFMNKGRKVMLKWMERYAYMMPRLRPIIQEEGVPEDIVFLAMIESGLNPKAYSPAHAAGVWQFIPGTGKIYGLNVDRVYDERLHVEMSTRAACRYLRKLYDEFGDWYLAFAGYNCGEMRVEREIVRSRTRDYFGLSRLPKQTRGYVPAYLATRAICRDPEKYGFPPLPPEIAFESDEVWVNGCYQLNNIANAAGHDPVLVCELNPEFLRGVTPDGRAVKIRLPRKADSQFATRLANMPKTTVTQDEKVHKARAGETMTSIARRYGVSVAELKAVPENRRFAKSNRLRAGQRVTIPVTKVNLSPNAVTTAKSDAAPGTDVAVKNDPKASPAADMSKSTTTARAAKDEIVYTVHRGESLGKISRQLGVPVAEICRQNDISNPNHVLPGRKLRIRFNNPAAESPVAASKVQPAADSRMAAVKPVEPPVVAEVNTPTPPPTDLAKSQTNRMKLPDPRNQQMHTVQPGDTVWSIARIYGKDPYQILSWNRLTRKSRIYPGQELIINQ